MKEKILFFDIDGTLVGFDGKMPASTQEALRRAKENGHKLFLCTGRCRTQIYPWLLSDYPFDGLVMCAGANVYVGDEQIYHKTFGTEKMKALVTFLEESGASYLVQNEHGVVMTERCLRSEATIMNEIFGLEIEDGVDKRLLKVLTKEFNVSGNDIFFIPGPIDLTFLMKMYGLPGFDAYKTPKYNPAPVPAFMGEEDIFSVIRNEDVLVHHPYMSFDPVVKFVQKASVDPDVLAIKQTLYRVSGDSPIVAALARAADNGKQVTVLVELKARFDEEHNIAWAKMLEKSGCHVIYGLLGLKVHSKITMVVRREEDGIRRYVHLGTGNYNDSTAKLYTDMGIFTCDAQIGADATAVFNMLSGYSEPEKWYKLLVAPIWMKKSFLRLIEREKKNALAGKQAFIRAKMNSLCDPDIIEALYAASAAGVQISLLVRGICCLKTGIPGVSENI